MESCSVWEIIDCARIVINFTDVPAASPVCVSENIGDEHCFFGKQGTVCWVSMSLRFVLLMGEGTTMSVSEFISSAFERDFFAGGQDSLRIEGGYSWRKLHEKYS